MQVLKRLFLFLKPYWKTLLLSIILLLATSLIDLVPPLFQKQIVDEVIDVMGTLDDHVTSLPKILPEALRNAPIVQGLVHTSYGMVIFLDLHQLFSPRQNQDVAAKADAPVLDASIQALPEPAELNKLLVEVEG